MRGKNDSNNINSNNIYFSASRVARLYMGRCN